MADDSPKTDETDETKQTRLTQVENTIDVKTIDNSDVDPAQVDFNLGIPAPPAQGSACFSVKSEDNNNIREHTNTRAAGVSVPETKTTCAGPDLFDCVKPEPANPLEYCPSKLKGGIKCNGLLEEFKFTVGSERSEDDWRYRCKSCGDIFTREFLVTDFMFIDKKFSAKRMADFIFSGGGEYFFATSMNSILYRYHQSQGIWKSDGEEFVLYKCTSILRDVFKPHFFTDTLLYIRGTHFIDASRIGGPIELLPMKNGILNIFNREFEPFDELDSVNRVKVKDYYFITALPIIYDSAALCPVIDEKVGQWVDPADVLKLFEIAGWCLRRDYWIARIIILLGGGRNGKGTFIRLLKAFLGKENISAIELQKLSTSTYKSAHLYGKLANLCGDIPSNAMTVVGMLKQLSGSDEITVEKKYFDPFDFLNYAKLIFAANVLPASYEDTDAIYDRLEKIPFPHQFLYGDPRCDPELDKKLQTPEELSGFLNRALDGLARLMTNKKFTNEASLEERRIDYIKHANPVQYLSEVKLTRDGSEGAYITKDAMYMKYVEVCNELKAVPMAKNKFGGEIQRWCAYMAPGQTTVRDDGHQRRVHVWWAVKLVDVVTPKKGLDNFVDGLSPEDKRSSKEVPKDTSKDVPKDVPKEGVPVGDASKDPADFIPVSLDAERAALDVFVRLQGFEQKSVAKEVFINELTLSGKSAAEAERVFKVLNRSGAIYEVRPGFYKKL